MKKVQSTTFDQINTYAQKHNRTNFSNFEHYHRILGQDILELLNDYFDRTSPTFDPNEDKLIESVYKWAEHNTIIYYSDLLLWFNRNWSAIDEYTDNFGYCPKTDIIQVIQAAYRWTLEDAMINALNTIQNEIDAKEDGF